ncbi:hypothetical protein DFH09DRAFT_1355685 [Mycena vulgaris]|nr:hypothetical protein DFH09DRAFT_1355685 [Mycena vulgaris]
MAAGVRLGAAFSLSKSDDQAFLRRVAGIIAHQLLLTPHFFALASAGPDQNTLLLTGSSPSHVRRALLLATASLHTRISSSYTAPDGSLFTAHVQYITPADEPTLLRALRQTVARDMQAPPPDSQGAFDAVRGAGAGDEPTFIVDLRAVPRSGGITGSLLVDRNDLEWAFDSRLAASPSIASSVSASDADASPLHEALAAEAAAEEGVGRAQRLLISSSFAVRPILICPAGTVQRDGCGGRLGGVAHFNPHALRMLAAQFSSAKLPLRASAFVVVIPLLDLGSDSRTFLSSTSSWLASPENSEQPLAPRF